MSLARARLIEAGKMNWSLFGHKSGYHSSSKLNREIWFRSSWEELVMKFLDADETIETWDYERVRIPYHYKANKRWYVPDFLVQFKDGHAEIWEVKPVESVDNERVKLKSEAAMKYCGEKGISFKILTKQTLLEMKVMGQK